MKTESNRRRITWGLIGALVVLVPCFFLARLAGQTPPAQNPPASAQSADAGQQPVIKAESKLVLVDTVVTDKKGNYVHDLTQNDFKVFEDNKEQPVSSFSSGSDPSIQGPQQRRYLILFFDNSTMAAPEQIQAKDAAKKFIDSNAGPDRLMAVVDFGGSLQVAQNFTANADLLKAAVNGVKSSSVDPNAVANGEVASAALSPSVGVGGPASIASPSASIFSAEAEFGARTMLLAVRALATNLRTVPGRKMLVLFSGGFPMDSPEIQSELTATIAACNQANVAVYALDARGLVAAPPSRISQLRSPETNSQAAAARLSAEKAPSSRASLSNSTSHSNGASASPSASLSNATSVSSGVSVSSRAALSNGASVSNARSHSNGASASPSASLSNATSLYGGAHLLLASYSPAMPEPQRPGGGGGGGGGGGRPGGGGGGTGGGAPGGGGAGGGTGGGRGGGGTGGTGGSGGTGGTGGRGGTGGTGGGGGTRGTSGGGAPINNNYANSRYGQARSLVIPQLPPSTATNQQVLAALAVGTGGFTIFNTNDLLGGLEKIGREQNEFYLLGYVPPPSAEGGCHALKVKMNRGGLEVRSRTTYCNIKSTNILGGTPLEKQLEARASGAQAGSIQAAFETPYFYTAPNVARVDLAMEIPLNSVQFNKEKGKYRGSLNVLGIAYKPDGSVAARFSDNVNLDYENKDELKEATKAPYIYQNQFDAASGDYKLTLVVSSGGDAFGKFEAPLKIDSYDGKQFSLGGVVLSNSVQRVSEASASVDAALLEDRTPLVVRGMQINPSGSNRFKKTDSVTAYTELYDPQLTSATPPQVMAGYAVLERATQKVILKTPAVRLDDFVQKGSPMVPIALVVKLADLQPGGYRLVMMAVDSAGQHAPNRVIDFDLTD